MKFANIYDNRHGRQTIGDAMQLLAVDNLYSYMKINKEDIIYIPYPQLPTYEGEYVILPLSFPLYGYLKDKNITQFSPKIIPVFLGISTLSSNFSHEEIKYLKTYEPIGCRDLPTMLGMRQNGILAYLGGCLTATFPCRRSGDNKTRDKVFFVDIPDSFKQFVPEKIWGNGEFISHTVYRDECSTSLKEQAKMVYETYIKEAKFVVTTRLHAALPCLAAGIPVIWAKDFISFRFAGIDKLTHIYTKDEYEMINWEPEPVYYENQKKTMLELASKRVMDTYNQYKDIFEVSSFYEGRVNRSYFKEFYDNTVMMIQDTFDKNEEFEYILWGVTQTADLVFHYLSENYPGAKLVAVVDKNKEIEFCGVKACKKEIIEKYQKAFCFVCTGNAILEAYQYFEKIQHMRFYQCCEDGNKHDLEKSYDNTYKV